MNHILKLPLAAVALCLAAGAAQAQTAPTETTMVKLIRGLIQSGALNKDAGDALLAQAMSEAGGQKATVAAAGDVRVPYIPQTVRDQIRDDIKGQVLAEAKAGGWAAPNETPEWSKRIHVEGDLRTRYESRYYDGTNSDIEIDWRNLNAGTGYDVNSNTNLALPALLNTRQDRKHLLRVRARFGLGIDLSDTTQAGIRLATGNDDSPVTTTQTLGGNLGKKNVWLDQAWLSYRPASWLTLTAGRFDNPFIAGDELFSSELNMDGVTAKVMKPLGASGDVAVFGTLGLIPLEYSSDNAPSRSQVKMGSETKYLLGAQFGASWKVNADHQLRAAAAYYNFRNINGEYSAPCALYAGADGCSTDWSRPVSMQKGNSLMLLRNIALNPLDPANTAQPQYVGLASKFRLANINARWDARAGGTDLRLEADLVRNMAYDQGAMFARAKGGILNNFGGTGGTTQADFKSGANAYMAQATLGTASPKRRSDWNAVLGYKRIEADALPDAYNDSTFHLGGTNARGYYIGGSYALANNTWFTARWTSTREVAGPALAIDTLQFDLNARF